MIIHMSDSNDILFKAAQWCMMGLAFLLPLWFLPSTIAPVEFNKTLLISLLVFLSFILYLAHAIRSGSVSFPHHKIFILLGATLLSWLVSAIVSKSSIAVLGVAAETTSFLAILTFSLMGVMIMLLFSDTKALMNLFMAIFSGLAVFLASVWILSVFNFGPQLGGVFADRIFNPIGSWNSVGLITGFLVVALYPFLFIVSKSMRWIIAALLLLGLLLILVVNFQLVWEILGIFAVLLLSYAVWHKNITGLGAGAPLLLLILSIFAFLSFNMIGAYTKFPAPTEVSVSHSATYNVVTKALQENMVFGTGPASFGYLWDKYKPAAVNNTQFWSLRFTNGSSYLLSLLAEVGLLGGLLFFVFLGWVWYIGLKILTHEENKRNAALIFSAFLMFSYSVLMWLLYSVGYVLVVFGFLSLGVLLASAAMSGFFRAREFSLVREGPRGFIIALGVVFFIILGALGVYAITTRYIGEMAFSRGLAELNNGNFDVAENQMLLAIQSDANNDVYSRTLSQVYMSKARVLLQDRSTPSNLLGSRFKDFLDKAVFSAQNAINTGPEDFQNYRALGQIYAFLIQLNAAGSVEAAMAQFDNALKYAPNYPVLWTDKALAYLTDFTLRKNQDSLKKAEAALLQAIALKPDYADGHFLLTQVYDAEGKAEEAIKRGEAAAFWAPNDIGTLFQLGLLYYRANRLSDAETVFKRAVDINTNYSNARYFLGLIYDRTNRKADSISEFEKIYALNPDNNEVERILINLRSGKSALNSIGGPAPEKRTEAPVKESNKNAVVKPKKGI